MLLETKKKINCSRIFYYNLCKEHHGKKIKFCVLIYKTTIIILIGDDRALIIQSVYLK